MVQRRGTGGKLKKKYEPTVREILTSTYLLRCKQLSLTIEEMDQLDALLSIIDDELMPEVDVRRLKENADKKTQEAAE